METTPTTQRAVIVTIDTEEEGRWSVAYPRTGNTVRNIARMPRIQSIFERVGARPTYLVDYPVAADAESCSILRGFCARGGAEIGAHLHPWCNPPFDEADAAGRPATFPHNLPPQLQERKLRLLCDAIQSGTGMRPTSYRAGRWGFNHTTVPVLESLGIRVDTSVTPLWWDASEGGPEFARAPLVPYRLSRTDACSPGDSGVVEVPTSNMIARPWGAPLEGIARMIGRRPGMRRLLVGLGLRSLRPEQYSLAEMIGLADTIARRGLRVFNIMFHSSVALPGATPYASSSAEMERFCERLEGILVHVRSKLRAVPLTLSEVPGFLGDAILSVPRA
jgi:hypothetical protein